MSGWYLVESSGSSVQGSIGANSLEERDAVRRYLANRVRHECPQEWNRCVNELGMLIDMLGLWPQDDPQTPGAAPHRARVRDCGPALRASNRIVK
jgi:hypothetical protein